MASLILAAGKGVRMKSKLPKVLHQVCGKPMVKHVFDTICQIGIERPIVVIGPGHQAIRGLLSSQAQYVQQQEPLGTGHAVMQAEGLLAGFSGDILILCGDTPLLRAQTLRKFILEHRRRGGVATILSAVMEDPTGYGRIIRAPDGSVQKIVEERDTSISEKDISEVNTGTYCFKGRMLFKALHRVRPDDVTREYYLTDAIGILTGDGHRVEAHVVDDPAEAVGVNSRQDLAVVEKLLCERMKTATKTPNPAG